jgi:GH15 family glucan-1,4-alpha-glucosidase
MPYPAIEDHGVIGDMHTVALVDTSGTIDWCCLPRFDSGSVFASILDDEKGGRFEVHSLTERSTTKQFYWPGTNILVTRFLSREGVGEVTDYMPVGGERRSIVRTVEAASGRASFRMRCLPAFDYGRAGHELTMQPGGACFRSNQLSLGLSSPVPLRRCDGGVEAVFTLERGHTATFVLEELGPGEECGDAPSEEQAESLFRQTVDYWRGWLAGCSYTGRWREVVHRSALALKLLTYQPTGAIVAAPTCSLPEGVAGVRNWDYRYTWIRDAAFTLYGFLRIGFTDEARAFMEFLSGLCQERSRAEGPLQIMYGIDGRADLAEETLGHLHGYRGSKPVRIGNGAHRQLQLDIYGELLDSVYLYDKYGAPISFDLWRSVRAFVDWVCGNWRRPDEGVWESRAGRRDYVYSKLMCWVAVDRGLRLADKRSLPADRSRWLLTRDEIYHEIMTRGWSAERRSFVQSFGSETLDAALLMMPLVLFISPADPRLLATLDAIQSPPESGGLVSNSLVYRYNLSDSADGLSGEEGTFNICTFWLVEALTRAGRVDRERLERARLTFEQMLGYGNHLGLFAEQTGRCGEALGNYPQAFTHLALISAAFNLDRALDRFGE